MRISTKGRYALAVVCYISTIEENVTVLEVSQNLGLSKIYLEQIFSLLKKADILESIKGAKGGYRLILDADKITAYDILFATESTLFEKVDNSLDDNFKLLEKSLHECVYNKIDSAIEKSLKAVTVKDIVDNSGGKDNYMFYI